MKNKLIKTGILTALAACVALGTGCQKEEMKLLNNDSTESSGGAMEREMMNGRGAAEIRLASTWNAGMTSINLDIRRVAVHYANSTVDFGGWVYFPVRQQTIDILQYQDGKSTFLGGNTHLPDGVIDQARIELGDNSTVVWIDKDGKHVKNLTMTAEEHIANAKLNLRINKNTKLGLVLNINAVQSVTIIAGGETVKFHPHMKLARFTHESINGAPGEQIMADTK